LRGGGVQKRPLFVGNEEGGLPEPTPHGLVARDRLQTTATRQVTPGVWYGRTAPLDVPCPYAAPARCAYPPCASTAMVLSERRRAIRRARARVRLSVVVLACIVSGEAGLPDGDAETAMVASSSVAQRRLVCQLASRYSVSRRQRILKSADWRDRILFLFTPSPISGCFARGSQYL